MFKYFSQALLLVFFLTFSVAANAAPLKVVVFGDSLTAGYQLQPEQSFPAILERKLKAAGFDVEVENMSVVGETTDGGRVRLQSLLDSKPDVAIIELGTNDAARGLAINDINVNLHEIIAKIAKQHAGVVVAGSKAPPERGKAYSTQLDIVYGRVAGRSGATFYPDILAGVSTNPKLTLADGIHPNAEGTKVMVDRMYPYIDRLLRWRIKVRQFQATHPQ